MESLAGMLKIRASLLTRSGSSGFKESTSCFLSSDRLWRYSAATP